MQSLRGFKGGKYIYIKAKRDWRIEQRTAQKSNHWTDRADIWYTVNYYDEGIR